MFYAVIWGGLAAGALLIGYFLAKRELPKMVIGLIMGIGAGALISAIAYELVPETALDKWGMGLVFALGALTFFFGDWLIDRRGGANRKGISVSKESGSGAAIFIGTLLDAIPESIILGMSVALGGVINAAILAAVFISNLPEGAAGTINLKAAGYSQKRIYWMWMILVFSSAACAGLGYYMILNSPGADGKYAQAFAAGAMLTMLTDAMIPEAFEHGGMFTGLFTVMGFLFAAILSIAQ
jgi:ZIP family zinc transporter